MSNLEKNIEQEDLASSVGKERFRQDKIESGMRDFKMLFKDSAYLEVKTDEKGLPESICILQTKDEAGNELESKKTLYFSKDKKDIVDMIDILINNGLADKIVYSKE